MINQSRTTNRLSTKLSTYTHFETYGSMVDRLGRPLTDDEWQQTREFRRLKVVTKAKKNGWMI